MWAKRYSSFVSLIFRADDGVNFTRTLGLECTFGPFEPSEYPNTSDTGDGLKGELVHFHDFYRGTPRSAL